ncbi:MAG: AMP-binding protein [Polaromonas sp.]|uniref:AMP-binding protein n=1 Tax=Polaromonas sp. TaxID=1869339 RepID=UPI002734D82D|nr:AMP-binding protein [Polaromonas sp.]MDP2820125.1 AMP-binding protein [Polaromonas sp.]
MSVRAFRNLADIQALEATPYDQAIPAQTTYGLITHAAQRFADRDAFRYLSSGDLEQPAQPVSYRELLAQIHRAANLFRALGAGPEDAVAILAPNIPETQFALWGAQLACKACPINYLLQPAHIAALLAASAAKVLVALGPNSELSLWPTIEKVLALRPLPVLQIRVGEELAPGVPVFQDVLARQSDVLAFDPMLTPGRIAACFHTGGTTGAPKLAQHTHGNEAHTGWFAHYFYGFDEHTVELNGFPLFHVAGAFVYGLSLLAIGGAQVLPTLSGMRNPDFQKNYWKFCEREQVTALACVPTILATLVNLPVDADISSVRVTYTGGSPLPTELAAQFERKTGIAVRNILGMTECAGLVSIEPAAAPRVPGSTGLRLAYTEVRAVPWQGGAAQLGKSCATGETGVLVVRGPHVSPGYTDAARNTGMFDGPWLVSGDLGHLDAQGYIHITGRAKDVIIRGSHNIAPGLVEDAFLAHPAVALCAVVAEPDAYAGELPVAFVTLKPGAVCDAATLLAEVAPQVYERPAIPKRVTIIDEMPLTAIGKIYKPALRLRALETKLTEMLADVPGVTVQGQERGGSLSAVVLMSAPLDTALVQGLRARLAAIAVPVEFVAPA